MADHTACWELELPGRVEPPSTPTTPSPTWDTRHLVDRELHAYPASARCFSSSAPASFSRTSSRTVKTSTFTQSPCDAAALARATEERHRRISTTHPPEVLAVRRMKAYPSLPGLSGKYDGSWDGKLDGHHWGCGKWSRSRAREEATGKAEKGLEA